MICYTCPGGRCQGGCSLSRSQRAGQASASRPPGEDIQSYRSKCSWLTVDVLLRVGVFMQVNFFVLDRTPEPFGENAVANASIHTDLNTSVLQVLVVLRTGKVVPWSLF